MSQVEEMMFHYWFMLTTQYKRFVSQLEEEDGFSGLVVALILILIAVAVAAYFRDAIGDYVDDVFESLPNALETI